MFEELDDSLGACDGSGGAVCVERVGLNVDSAVEMGEDAKA